MRYGYVDMVTYVLTIVEETLDLNEDFKLSNVISCEDVDKWLVIMKEEINSFHKNQT